MTRAELAEALRLIDEDLLTHRGAAELLGVSEGHVRDTRFKLAALGARYVILPSNGKKGGERGNWRWSRRSLLALPRTAEEQKGGEQ